MYIFDNIGDIRNALDRERKKRKTIGFVPTMGYLHNGHESLLIEAKKNNDIIVLSIYINPTQFGPNEDLEKYPRDIDSDIEIAKRNGVDYIFYPNNETMYPSDYCTYVNVEDITKIMCGTSRLVHFRGVTTIVTKLFNIINPNDAYFGQKDAQQAIVIKQMVNDLNMNIKIKVCPIIRENDGLAMSSRNAYLTVEERKVAPEIYNSLLIGEEKIKSKIEYGLSNDFIENVKEEIHNRLAKFTLIDIEYIELLDAENLKNYSRNSETLIIAVAVKIGKTRLIDNILIKSLKKEM